MICEEVVDPQEVFVWTRQRSRTCICLDTSKIKNMYVSSMGGGGEERRVSKHVSIVEGFESVCAVGHAIPSLGDLCGWRDVQIQE